MNIGPNDRSVRKKNALIFFIESCERPAGVIFNEDLKKEVGTEGLFPTTLSMLILNFECDI